MRGLVMLGVGEAEAEAAVAATARHVRPGTPPHVQTWVVRYRDRYVRVDGRWRIARRELHRLWIEEGTVSALRRAPTV